MSLVIIGQYKGVLLGLIDDSVALSVPKYAQFRLLSL